MPENTLSYNMILEYFGEETIRDRYRFLYDKMQKYIDERSLTDNLVVNEGILQQAIMDYFTDVYRLKEFHKIDQINKSKIVAYESYWILRRKPIQVQQSISINEGSQFQKKVFSNEGFIVTMIANELLMPNEMIPLSSDKEDALMTFLDHLYYHLKYRCIDKQSLETMLYAFDVGRTCS